MAGARAVEVVSYMVSAHATGETDEGLNLAVKPYFRALVFREQYPRRVAIAVWYEGARQGADCWARTLSTH